MLRMYCTSFYYVNFDRDEDKNAHRCRGWVGGGSRKAQCAWLEYQVTEGKVA